MPLQASILTPSPVPLASGLRAILPEVPAHPHSPGGSSSSFGSGRPNGLSATVPCLQRAFAAYPRPDEAGPAVFHDPLHAARLWIVRAYRDRPTLTSRPPPAVRSRSKGLARPLRGRLKSVYLPLVQRQGQSDPKNHARRHARCRPRSDNPATRTPLILACEKSGELLDAAALAGCSEAEC